MKLFIFSCLLVLTTGCSMNSFTKKGNAPFCLVKYQEKIIDCSYDTISACREKYQDNPVSICFTNKDLK